LNESLKWQYDFLKSEIAKEGKYKKMIILKRVFNSIQDNHLRMASDSVLV